MNVATLQGTHLAPLGRFFAALPPVDLTFIKEDVHSPATLAGWLSEGPGVRFVALEEGDLVGYLAVVPLTGWSAHVGEVRLVVHPDRRGRGIGRALAREALVQAVEMGLCKVIVEVVAAQESTVGMFRALGWQGEALLTDHIRDRDGQFQDLLVLAYRVEEEWTALEVTGVAESLRPR